MRWKVSNVVMIFGRERNQSSLESDNKEQQKCFTETLVGDSKALHHHIEMTSLNSAEVSKFQNDWQLSDFN